MGERIEKGLDEIKNLKKNGIKYDQDTFNQKEEQKQENKNENYNLDDDFNAFLNEVGPKKRPRKITVNLDIKKKN